MGHPSSSDPLGQREANTVDELVRRRRDEINDDLCAVVHAIDENEAQAIKLWARHNDLVAARNTMDEYLYARVDPSMKVWAN